MSNDIQQQWNELREYVEANPDLHHCNAFYFLSRMPEHLLPIASAFIEVDLLYGFPDPDAPEPVGLLNA